MGTIPGGWLPTVSWHGQKADAFLGCSETHSHGAPTHPHLPFPAWLQNDSKVSCPQPSNLARTHTPAPLQGEHGRSLSPQEEEGENKALPKTPKPQAPLPCQSRGVGNGAGGQQPQPADKPCCDRERGGRGVAAMPWPSHGTQGCVKPGAERGSILSAAGEQIRPFGR